MPSVLPADRAELKILHVDDDADDRTFLAAALKSLNLHHQLTSATSCDDLFDILDAEIRYDLIILDINMPAVSGIECLKKLKAHEKYRDIPVVLFTVSISQSDIDEAYTSGAYFYVVKPYSALNFAETLKKIFDTDFKARVLVPSREDFVINYAFV